MELQGNSRIGATIKGDMIDARFELGIGSNSVINRRLYGVWKFTEGWGLKIGQDYTPITFFLSGQVFDTDAGLLNVGNAYGSRRGQIALEGKAGPGMLKVALIDQTTSLCIWSRIRVDQPGHHQRWCGHRELYPQN